MTMAYVKLTIISFISLLLLVDSRLVTRCDLAKALDRQQVSRTFISNWVCLAEFESARNTSIVIDYPSYSSYGIFQVKSKDACGNEYVGKLCNIRCADLLKDDLTNSINCAKKIFNEKGFQYWDKWMKNCKTRPLPDIRSCFGTT